MKRVVSALLALTLLASVLLCMPITTSAESLYIRKVVSVVCDDSGSMNGDKWAFANYAMQSFCGMLNSDDQLYITYMSEATEQHKQEVFAQGYVPPKVDLSAGGIQGSVDYIRSCQTWGGTPYRAVEIAFEKLRKTQDPNPNTQYWLVVITDGEFAGLGVNTQEDLKDKLEENFHTYTSDVMPNGSHPQVTFMGIGGVIAPDEDINNGIHVYEASDANGIIGAMSKMADRISGRTRLQKKDMKKINENTIQVSSSIPLLNIAVFAQRSDAKVTGVVYGNEIQVPVTRQASLWHPAYNDLTGGAFLLGDSQTVIGSGTYNITFDRAVSLDDVVILFEPALEMRMTIKVNGKEITDKSELDNTMEGDKVSVSCKIYEMGTDIEVDPSLMPPNTTFEITVSEDGKVVDQVSGKEMLLSDYVLKNINTQITASVLIDGFSPIARTVKFTPTKFVPRIVYTITPSFEGGVKSVRYDAIAGNKDMAVCFTVNADGVPMTDAEAVKALKPTVSVSPEGNGGSITYSADGKIVFTPNAASTPASNAEKFDVDVTCTLENGVSAKATYTVLVADYQVIPVANGGPVKKTELYDNTESVFFYITKDGVKLDKSSVESGISVLLNEEQASLKTTVSVADDGTITVTPYREGEHRLTFWNWWGNWWHYWRLPGDDVVVTLSHSFGTAKASIDVVGESVPYQIFCVWLPFAIELIVLLFLIWWIYAIIAKPKFLPGAVLYYAKLSAGGKRGDRYHEIGKVYDVTLKQYNALKYQLAPWLKSKKHWVGDGLLISAGPGGSIVCHNAIWFKGRINPIDEDSNEFPHPHYVQRYVDRSRGLKIELISPYDGNAVRLEETTIDDPKPRVYYVHTDMAKISTIDGIQVIDNGIIFAYAIQLDN